MVIYHEILNDEEIKYLIDESELHLSKVRKKVKGPNVKLKSGEEREIIHKAQ